MNILFLCTTDSMIWNFMVSHIKRLESEGCKVECACSMTGIYFNELQNQGIIMNEISFKRSPYNPSNLIAFRQLVNLFKHKKYDIIFCHEPVGGAFGRIIGKIFNVRIIYMAHGFHFFNGAPAINWLIYYNVEKFLSRWTDLLITINKEDYEASRSFHAKEIELVNGIGVDTRKFKKYECHYLEEKYNLDNESIKLLSVGELIHRKNHLSIIKALQNYKGENVHYFIAGDGVLADELKQIVKDYGLEKQIHFLGFCRNVSDLCNSCDIFVFPSVHEGLSLALMEAMSCGKPIVASCIRGNVDLIKDQEGGLLVGTYDVEGYVSAISNLIKNKDMRISMGEKNQKNVVKYDIKTIENKIVELLLNK